MSNPQKQNSCRISPLASGRFIAQAILLGLALCMAPVFAGAQSTLDEAGGTISGRVFDADNGSPLSGATVVLTFPAPADGSDPRQIIATSGPDGDFEFDVVPAGSYELNFVKSGYRLSSIKDFAVEPGRDNVANFPMPRSAAIAGGGAGGAAGGDVMQLEEYVVDAAVIGDLMQGLELRLESDQMLNLLSAEDLSKYAASDVADALKRVAGVNVVEGQFAVVRGLEDRYSNTLFNGAPVPSPDPDSQSVQLDLFPSDVVTNLVIAKSFAPDSPSNSAAGSINIITQDYPEELTLKVQIGAGFEEGALDRFIRFDSGSTTGYEANSIDLAETDFGGSFGGHYPVFGKDLRFKAVLNHEIDYRSEIGFQESREPRIADIRSVQGSPRVLRSGDLARGRLSLSDGYFDIIQSTRDEQLTASFGMGIDLDEEGMHKIDFSSFYTKKDEETVQLRENGFFRDFDYTANDLIELTEDGDDLNFPLEEMEGDNPIARNPVATPGSRLAGAEDALRVLLTESPARGALWFANFGRTSSFERKRNLQLYQFNGSHEFDLLDGLKVTWAANHATTEQDEVSLGMRFTFEPCGFTGGFDCPAGVSRIAIPRRFPARVEDLGPGSFIASGTAGGIVFTDTQVDESQWFGRMDFDQDVSPTTFLDLNAKGGVWWEKSRRGVESLFVDSVTVNRISQWFLASPTLEELGGTLFDRLDAPGNRVATNRSKREITAGYLNLKMTFWEDVDLVGGLRIEQIEISSENDPFTGEVQFTRPATFPPAYLFFDRLDNPDPDLGGEASSALPNTTFNDQIVNVDVPINPDTGFVDLLTREQILQLVNGEIDEFKVLPSVGIAYRPIEGLTLRGSYSETVARPSFREMGYYVTVEPGTDDRIVGNPQLQLSDVISVDFRGEYVFGDLGDLFAFSAFYKSIENPIESIVLRNPLDADSGSAALFRTSFNNANTARLWGIEVEGRKSFDFLRDLGLDFPGVDAFEYLSIGGNFSYIEAKVGRSDAEIRRTAEYFALAPGDTALIPGYKGSRRLFGQPKWIANADISFDHEDWGTTVTLALFAISDILDAAGSTALGPDGVGRSQVLDRYLDSFYQLDLVMSQRIWGGLKAKVSVKNLTDTRRRRIYDQEQTIGKVTERELQSGRDWSFSLSYSYEF